MPSFHEDLERRIGQFGHYLKLMHHRAHEEAHGSCFLIFEERRPGSDSGDEKLSENKKLALVRVSDSFSDPVFGGTGTLEESVVIDLPDQGWRQDDSQERFVQFSFERKWFCLDMPRQTLYRAEAEQILRRRDGFFYLRDRPQFTLHDEAVDGYDPFRKIYVYGDEESAAEDTAYVFFEVWRFPVDWRLFVTSAAFNGIRHWERGWAIA